MAQLGKARAWKLRIEASELVALCASGVQISPSALSSLVPVSCRPSILPNTEYPFGQDCMDSPKQEPAQREGIRGLLTVRGLEAGLSWISGLVLFFATAYTALNLDVLWVAFGITALTLFVLPLVATKDPFKALPWEMTLLMAAPILLHISSGSARLNESLTWWRDLTSLAFAFSLATIGFLLTVELQIFTNLRMNRPFAVFFVVMFTLAVAGFWGVGEFIGDKVWGTDYLGSNYNVMMDFVWTLVGGVAMGGVYYLYLRATPKRRRERFAFMHMWEEASWKRN